MSEQIVILEEDLAPEEPQGQGKTWQEEIQVSGDQVVGKVQELLHEAAVRKITVKDAQGKSLISIPLYAGVAGVLLLGPWTALALVGAWLGNFSIVIEYEELEAQEARETAVAVAGQARPAAANDLTGIKGIGPKKAEKLAAAGITRIDQLAKLTVAELMEIGGVNQETARAWIAQAEAIA